MVVRCNLTVLHHIAMRREYATLALTHLSANFTKVQICVDFIRYIFQRRYKVIIRVKFAEGSIVMSFVGNLAMRHAVCHIDEPIHRNGSVLSLNGIHHHHALKAVQFPCTQGRQPLGEVVQLMKIDIGLDKLRQIVQLAA